MSNILDRILYFLFRSKLSTLLSILFLSSLPDFKKDFFFPHRDYCIIKCYLSIEIFIPCSILRSFLYSFICKFTTSDSQIRCIPYTFTTKHSSLLTISFSFLGLYEFLKLCKNELNLSIGISFSISLPSFRNSDFISGSNVDRLIIFRFRKFYDQSIEVVVDQTVKAFQASVLSCQIGVQTGDVFLRDYSET